MVAVDVDTFVLESPGDHDDETVLQSHGQPGPTLAEEEGRAFDDHVVFWLESWIKGIGTVVEFVEGSPQFPEEGGMSAAQFSLDVGEDLGELGYFLDGLI